MPNWCVNTVTAAGPGASIAALRAAVRSRTSDFALSAIIPIPARYLPDSPTSTDAPDTTSEDLLWWANRQWGTKWDTAATEPGTFSDGDGDRHRIVWQLETAWTTPTPALNVLASRFPDVDLTVCASEPGTGYTAVLTWRGGQRGEDCPVPDHGGDPRFISIVEIQTAAGSTDDRDDVTITLDVRRFHAAHIQTEQVRTVQAADAVVDRVLNVVTRDAGPAALVVVIAGDRDPRTTAVVRAVLGRTRRAPTYDPKLVASHAARGSFYLRGSAHRARAVLVDAPLPGPLWLASPAERADAWYWLPELITANIDSEPEPVRAMTLALLLGALCSPPRDPGGDTGPDTTGGGHHRVPGRHWAGLLAAATDLAAAAIPIEVAVRLILGALPFGAVADLSVEEALSVIHGVLEPAAQNRQPGVSGHLVHPGKPGPPAGQR
jgi:hypothetical protein